MIIIPQTINAVIFDLDGTLLNTLDDLATATNHAMQELSMPTHSTDEYRRFVGDGVRNLMRRALTGNDQITASDMSEEAWTELESHVESATKIMQTYYAEHWHDATKIYQCVSPLLHLLRLYGIPVAVLSNKPHSFTIKIVEHFFPDYKFSAIQGGMPDLPLKPDPTTALTIIHKLGVRPEHTLLIGDSNTDIFTALNAGMIGLGAAWGFRGAEELRNAGAFAILKKPLDLFLLTPRHIILEKKHSSGWSKFVM